MRILYVWDADYPWDVRTEKVCLALTQRGHHVVIGARNLSGQPRTIKLAEGLVERLPRFPQRARRVLSFPAFFNPVWVYHLLQLISRHQIDLIIVRDLPLAPTALFASRGRLPVILDMAENYPAMIEDIWSDGRQGLLDVLVRNPRLVEAVERYTLRRVSHTLTVVRESSTRLIDLGTPAERLTVVSNTPPRSRITDPRPGADQEPLRLVYVGLMELHRGVLEVLDAARILASASISFALDLVGDGRDMAQFRQHARDLALDSGSVRFHGRLPHADAMAVVGKANVGIIPHHATAAWNSTIPNKLFDYMAAGLAVIASDAEPTARVVREVGSGLVFKSGDAVQLAAAATQCLDTARRVAFGQAGRAAIRSSYNWESDAERLYVAVEQFALGPSRAAGSPGR